MARPTKNNPKGLQKKPKLDDPKTIEKLEEAFMLDCTVEEACFNADIHPDTYYNLLKLKPKLTERFKALRNNPIFKARNTVIREIENDGKLALEYLKNKRKDEFSTKNETDNKTTNTNIEVIKVIVE